MVNVVPTTVLPELGPGTFETWKPAMELALFVVALEAHPILINRHVMINSDNPMYSNFFI
jgi:hypothetical protein